MSILLVDDSEDIRLIIKAMLKKDYEDILTASSAEDAFCQLGISKDVCDDLGANKVEIDLILMDLFMPGMNGIEACSYIKSFKKYDDIPVIMVTAMDDVCSLEKAFSAGAVDYIRKPFNKIELSARLNYALKLKIETDKRKDRERELEELNVALQSVNEQLKRLSSLDGLTGISNRRSFDERLAEEWGRARRSVSPLSLIMLDIDFFKPYNDSYGHIGGDECLVNVANILKKTLHRPADFLARYGGEEFIVVLPETDAEGANKIAEDLRSAVESMGVPHKASSVAGHVTISLGTATMTPAEGTEPSALIEVADNALYAAKEGGRNRVGTAKS